MFERLKAAFRTGKDMALTNSDGVSMGADSRAQSATMAVKLVVALTVGGLVAAFLLPVALDEIVGVDTSNYSSGAASLWNILDIIVVLAMFLFFVGVALAAMDRV